MNRIAIIGKGNVGFHLFEALKDLYEVSLIDSRTLQDISASFDILLITVSDSAIPAVAGHLSHLLPDFGGIVTHTSGSVPMDILQPYFQKYGVFYPLQTFSKNIPISAYSEIPIFIEGSSSSVNQDLREFACKAFPDVYSFSSVKREKLHLASVFACNFVNAMYSIAEEILQDNDIPFEVVHSLIRQTTLKALANSPSLCQTGPARRGDRNVIDSQLSQLSDSPELATIYQIITKYIISKYQSNAASGK